MEHFWKPHLAVGIELLVKGWFKQFAVQWLAVPVWTSCTNPNQSETLFPLKFSMLIVLPNSYFFYTAYFHKNMLNRHRNP